MKSAVIVPTNRPDRIQQFITAWAPQFNRLDVSLIVIEDAPEWTFNAPGWVEHHCHKSIVDTLGDAAACIPTRSGGCRDFGFWLAGQSRSIDMVVSLDDDVLPLPDVDFLGEHWQALETPRSLKWWPLFPGFRLRGEPYGEDKIKPVLNLGLWYGYPDIDAFTQFDNPDAMMQFGLQRPVNTSGLIPPGMYYPQCGMNWACRREVVPFAYFPKLPAGMKRFDDIWSGFIFKRLADLYGWPVVTGIPCVKHERASNPASNLRQEMLGYGINEEIWKALDKSPDFSHMTPLAAYSALIHNLGEEFRPLREMARLAEMWASLWEESQ